MTTDDSQAAAPTINQIVAHNFAQARRRAGLTQQETARRLTRLTGTRWTEVTVCNAERSVKGTRVKEFRAIELLAFSELFGMPVARFLLPPADENAAPAYALGPSDTAARITSRRLLDHVLARRPKGEYRDLVHEATRTSHNTPASQEA
ncbi:hypothetical protein [Acrocarpospora sp. B8E8]|uniref:hypothetical protein n=1 Tax=Acrocarpospora sp. B8E8 TaxID=3153572 RepID=UPI00325E291F